LKRLRNKNKVIFFFASGLGQRIRYGAPEIRGNGSGSAVA
jgi:hypothetical protein